ncbi:enoyl-CoA hydratase-related protein [Paraburkholderia sp. C35]|uniref:enoyl-CoA hydratase-related protein n=1 Tax=Paraburkholderia sp. C35 TaxID=2126993 RepID=UPI000D69214B|nr:enoyl-CoA hydratase-related protein [Paraburkholderia sp. C35]
MTEHISVSIQDGVKVLTLNRASKMNAITDAMYTFLAEEITAAQTDPAVRVVVLLGDGDNFTAGNDISTFAQRSEQSGASSDALNPGQLFLRSIGRATKPLIAGVQGRAVGVGVTMLMHCDYVVVANDATLQTPFVNLALVPEAASTILLVARIGHARAFSMFTLATPIDGNTAVAWGIANEAVGKADVHKQALAAAKSLANRAPSAVVATKKLMRKEEAILAQMMLEDEQFSAQIVSEDAREAFRAFTEKRPPVFRK